MSLFWRLTLVFVVQAAALLYMIADRQWTLTTGIPVVLETEPVDPRSLFSGDYVRLNYKISRLSLDKVGGERDFHEHDTVYVLLRRGEPYAEPVAVYKSALAVATLPVGHLWVRGEVTGNATSTWDTVLRRSVAGDYLFVRYGLETYFVPEGEGRALERPGPEEKVTIRVAVDARGRGAIQALLVNGEERYVERLF